MIDKGKRNILGVNIDCVDYEAAVNRVVSAAKRKQAYAVSALAVHGVMTGALDPVHRFRLNRLDLVTPDGQPVRWAINWLYRDNLPDRVYGPNLTLQVCERAAVDRLPVYIYGSREDVARAFADNLTKRIPELSVAGIEPSQFRHLNTLEKNKLVSRIHSSGARLTLVGLGCPRQEVWVYEYRDQLSMPLLAVGAAFDFHAGKTPQAPIGLQNLGLEWLFRLSYEPKRLWKRYLLLNPLFIWYLLLQKVGLKKFDPNHAQAPISEQSYG